MKIGLLLSKETENIQITIDDLCNAFPEAFVVSGFANDHTTESLLDFIAINNLRILLIDENFPLDYDMIGQGRAILYPIEKRVKKSTTSEAPCNE